MEKICRIRYKKKTGSADDVALATRLIAGDQALADQLLTELRQRRLLNQVAEAVNGAGGLDALLPSLVSLMAAALGADCATLFLHDAAARLLFSRVASVSSVLEIRIPQNGGIAGSVFRSGQAERVDEAYADTRFNSAVDKFTGYKTETVLAATVLAADGRTVGVVQLLNKAAGPFTEAYQDQALSMAWQAASALEKAWLHQQLECAKLNIRRIERARSPLITALALRRAKCFLAVLGQRSVWTIRSSAPA